MKPPSTPSPSRPRQSGAVLITVLVILTVLTILGLASIQSTTMEEHIVGNYRDRQLAFQAAEAGLRAGEAKIYDDTTFDAMAWDGSDGTFDGDPSLDPERDGDYYRLERDQTHPDRRPGGGPGVLPRAARRVRHAHEQPGRGLPAGDPNHSFLPGDRPRHRLDRPFRRNTTE